MSQRDPEKLAAARARLRAREQKWNAEYPYFHFRNCISRLREKSECDILAADLRELWFRQGGKCAMSGLSLSWGGPIQSTTVSIDRVVPARGYVEGNIRLVCFGLNALRGSGTDAEALRLAKAFVARSEEQPV